MDRVLYREGERDIFYVSDSTDSHSKIIVDFLMERSCFLKKV